MRLSVYKYVLWLYISMADSHAVDVGYSSEQLIGIKFHIDVWHILLLFHIVFHYFVKCIWDVLHHDV